MPSGATKQKMKEKKTASKSVKIVKAPKTNNEPIPSIKLLFPPSLTPRQRAAIHSIGESQGLQHDSHGDGDARYITLGPLGANNEISVTPDDKPAFEDNDLVALIQKHLDIDSRDAFDSSNKPKSTTNTSNGHAKPTASFSFSLANNKKTAGQLKPLDVDQFTTLMCELLELERDAELQQATEVLSTSSPEVVQAKGRALLNLRLTDMEGGLLGRTLLTFVNNKRSGNEPLPPHKITTHDVVRIKPNKADSATPAIVEGIVSRVKETAITVAVDDAPGEGLDVPLRLEKMANEVTYKRLKAAVQQLPGANLGPSGPLIDVLFGRRTPSFQANIPSWTPLNSSLDESQQRAVTKALAAQDLALIHGPPGTGKTTAVTEFIAQEVARGSRVLACAASNIAVDNLVERLASIKLPGDKKVMEVVRSGHPARLLPQILDSSLEAKVLRSDDSALSRDCAKESKDLRSRLLKLGRKDYDERRKIRSELRQLAKEERKRQELAVTRVLASAKVVCSTLTGLGSRQLDSLPHFDVVVIDEAAQAIEPACFAAILRGRKAVLAGDHLQLPPTVISEAAASKGLSRTLFERLQTMHGDFGASEMLTVQYRMNSSIMTWSSNELYEGKLQAHSSVASHALDTLPGASTSAQELPVLLLIDTAGCDMEESQEEEGTGESKLNQGEAKAAIEHVKRLVAAGIKPQDIGIITPYAAQVGLLRELRPESFGSALEISTVDGFQGREKEAIVISAVRCNPKGEVGFLADSRRMNVAVTRARRHCALVCDSETLGRDAFLGRLVKYFEDNGEYQSAAELVD